ncbi:MAG TPA: hypothetical protein VMT63_08290 [Bacteroidales bacterium]|nr:hypothetical protein [Bacteroidales bacterium]
MKKIFTFLGLIILSVLLMNSGSALPEHGNTRGDTAGSKKPDPPARHPKNVSVFLKRVTINGADSLWLRDSNKEQGSRNHVTTVVSGDTITWKLDANSHISKIRRIYPIKPKSVVFKNGTVVVPHVGIRLIAPYTKDTLKEEYGIDFSKGLKHFRFDPYIRVVPPPDQE